MADLQKRNPETQRKPSRLQRRAPASIHVVPAADWKVAIPLLSPLISPTDNDLTAEIKNQNPHKTVTETEKPMPTVFKKWQHPAAPFCYEQPPLIGVGRSLINS